MIINYLLEALTSGVIFEKKSTSDGVQPWCTDKGCDFKGNNCEDGEANDYSASDWYKVAMEYATPMEKEFNRILMSFGGKNTKRLISIKPESSFVGKVEKRGKSPCGIHDVLRGAILPPDQAVTNDIVKQMNKKLKVFEFEEKEKGKDVDFGYYGSYHFKIEMSDGMIAEIQVMPKRMWAYKKSAHKIYGDWRDVLGGGKMTPDQDAEFAKDKTRSKKIFQTANKELKKKSRAKHTRRTMEPIRTVDYR